MFLFLILVMGFLSRLAGGGFFAPLLNKLGVNWLPELLFALPFGLAFGSMFTGYVPSIVATAFFLGLVIRVYAVGNMVFFRLDWRRG